MQKITVQTLVNAPVAKVWNCWNSPDHIVKWYFAQDDWHVPSASNDLQVGGMLKIRMEAKDSNAGFDFLGQYIAIQQNSLVEFRLDDGRNVTIEFKQMPDGSVQVIETFDPEAENPLELQRTGWQAILDNFKKYVEANEN